MSRTLLQSFAANKWPDWWMWSREKNCDPIKELWMIGSLFARYLQYWGRGQPRETRITEKMMRHYCSLSIFLLVNLFRYLWLSITSFFFLLLSLFNSRYAVQSSLVSVFRCWGVHVHVSVRPSVRYAFSFSAVLTCFLAPRGQYWILFS